MAAPSRSTFQVRVPEVSPQAAGAVQLTVMPLCRQALASLPVGAARPVGALQAAPQVVLFLPATLTTPVAAGSSQSFSSVAAVPPADQERANLPYSSHKFGGELAQSEAPPWSWPTSWWFWFHSPEPED